MAEKKRKKRKRKRKIITKLWHVEEGEREREAGEAWGVYTYKTS